MARSTRVMVYGRRPRSRASTASKVAKMVQSLLNQLQIPSLMTAQPLTRKRERIEFDECMTLTAQTKRARRDVDREGGRKNTISSPGRVEKRKSSSSSSSRAKVQAGQVPFESQRA